MRLDDSPGVDSIASVSRPGSTPSLDLSTQLGSGDAEAVTGWRFSHWPECAEASLAWVADQSAAPLRRVLKRQLTEHRACLGGGADGRALALDGSDGVEQSGGVSPADEGYLAQRQALAWKQANGRAASESRRYFVRNALRYMWVLTFATAIYERCAVMGLVSAFARELRRVGGGTAFPYWYSPELHPGGHGWHVNFFVPHRLEHPLVEGVWGRGFVWVTDFARAPRAPKGEPLGLCRTVRDGWRRAAQYGCKYAQKDWSPEHVGRDSHRYEVAQGFAPVRERSWVAGRNEAQTLVSGLVPPEARPHLRSWDSNDDPEWQRPPVATWRW